MKASSGPLVLDGESLRVSALVRVARDPRIPVRIDDRVWPRVDASRAIVENAVRRYEQAVNAGAGGRGDALPLVYGVTTGYGEFKDRVVAPEELALLQQRLLLSHAAGVGANANADDLHNYFGPDVVRAALVLRLNAFLKGHSGVRREVINTIASMLNAGVVPLVPTRGSVGSSGDLCPLAHLFATWLGFGRFYVVQTAEDVRRGARIEELKPAASLAQALGTAPPAPMHKEGLALSNGATFSTAMLALAVFDAEVLVDTVDRVAALSLEAVCGRTRALDPKVHAARNMRGQAESAKNARAYLAGSRLADRCRQVQDAYSLRCAPQVHGASRDAIAYAHDVVTAEMNAATDNPLFFADAEPHDVAFRKDRGDSAEEIGDTLAYSAGNFHGQPIALAADFLSIAVAELANVSERRVQMLLDADHNRGLPANLTAKPGVNSGFMIAQYTAAALVSENKVLAHPASVDSIPTSSNSEDHVAMATLAARKACQVVANAQAVAAIEALVAAQAVEWRVGPPWIDPNGDTVDGSNADPDARLAAFQRQFAGGPTAAVVGMLGAGTRKAYEKVRERVETMPEDRMLSPDIWKVRELIETGQLR
ncbi:MAG: aromatic amino acid lyase [Planctomycetes bacterium]|nr:aromatic amino acid lyase [Planctomycetota bacterium]